MAFRATAGGPATADRVAPQATAAVVPPAAVEATSAVEVAEDTRAEAEEVAIPAVAAEDTPVEAATAGIARTELL